MKRKLIFQLLTVASLIFIFASCEYEYVAPEQLPPLDPTDTISFAEEIVPIFNEQSCNVSSCHGGTRQPDLRENNAYSSISSGYVTPFEPSDSPIYNEPAPSGTHLAKYTSEQWALVKQWIEQGALDN
jgi:hypothetical protein